MMAPMSLNCPALNHHTKPEGVRGQESWTQIRVLVKKKRREEGGRADIYGLRFLMR
jgi:hypothetical protein